MNLYKVNKKLKKYIDEVKDVKVPDVYDLYNVLSSDVNERSGYYH